MELAKRFFYIYGRHQVRKYRFSTSAKKSGVLMQGEQSRETSQVHDATPEVNDGTSDVHGAFHKDTESNKVLLQLNTLPKEDLAKYIHFRLSAAENLVKYREEHGPLKSVEDLHNIRGFAQKSIENISDSILLDNKRGKKISFSAPPGLILPRLQLDKVPDSVMAFYLMPTFLCWAQMDADLTLTDWDTVFLHDRQRLVYDHAVYQEKLHQVVEELPPSDVYLLENLPLHLTNVKKVPAALSRIYVEATLTTILNSNPPAEKDKCFRHKVYKLRFQEISKHFDLQVGSERVACSSVAKSIIKGNNFSASGVTVPSQQALKFRQMEPVDQEYLARCLLQLVVFYKQIIFRETPLEIDVVVQDSINEFFEESYEEERKS